MSIKNKLAVMVAAVALISPPLMATPPGPPQEAAHPLPPYMQFLGSCTALLVKNMPVDPAVGQNERVGLSSVACHCSYEQLSPRPEFTPTQFKNSLGQCVQRMTLNPSAFVAEYAPKVRARAFLPNPRLLDGFAHAHPSH